MLFENEITFKFPSGIPPALQDSSFGDTFALLFTSLSFSMLAYALAMIMALLSVKASYIYNQGPFVNC